MTANNRKHFCSENPFPPESAVIHYSEDHCGWYLTSFTYSVEGDVAMGESEQVGELMHQTELRIQYCPFCGVKL